MSATTGDGSIRRAENCFHPILLRRQCPRFFYHWLRWAPDIGSFLSARKRKPQQTEICGGSYREPGDDLLSLEIQPTIIGAEAFHCPVRNGKEWDRHAMVTRLKRGGKVKHSSFGLRCSHYPIRLKSSLNFSVQGFTVIGSSFTSN